jgi:hypothetical protein
MLKDDILNKDELFLLSTRRKRNAEKEVLIISRIKKISQRHETNEKQDEMIFSRARNERKRSDFSELDARKKNRGFLSEEERKSK